MQLPDEELKALALLEIEMLLQRNGRSLREYPALPFLDIHISTIQNKLIVNKLSYDRNKLREEHQTLLLQLTDEQRFVYNTVMSAVKENKSDFFFSSMDMGI